MSKRYINFNFRNTDVFNYLVSVLRGDTVLADYTNPNGITATFNDTIYVEPFPDRLQPGDVIGKSYLPPGNDTKNPIPVYEKYIFDATKDVKDGKNIYTASYIISIPKTMVAINYSNAKTDMFFYRISNGVGEANTSTYISTYDSRMRVRMFSYTSPNHVIAVHSIDITYPCTILNINVIGDTDFTLTKSTGPIGVCNNFLNNEFKS